MKISRAPLAGIILILNTAVAPPVRSAPGDVDPVFNPNVNGPVFSMAVQADGKIAIGGVFTSVGGVARSRVARVDTNGTLDFGFNPSANGGDFPDVRSLLLQVEGQLVIGGSFTAVNGTPRSGLARLHVDGTLDPDFNPDANGTVFSTAVQDDGRFVIGGSFTTVSGTTRNRIARLERGGKLDEGFDPSANGTVYCLVMQADGKIVIGGDFTVVGKAPDKVA